MSRSSGHISASGARRRQPADPARSGATLERAIVQTVAYADVFDYPLTADEIQRYLIGQSASRATVRAALDTSGLVPELLSHRGRFFSLVGREATFETRRSRAAAATSYWRQAVHYGRALGNLPFVRMVAVTGALAMDNVADGDIDYLLITEPGRLWLCRALAIGLVRAARLRGTHLCPNYFLSEHALELSERNLFTAHEVTQMVPLTGMATYRHLRALNRWTETFLPNADGPPHRVAAVEQRSGRMRRTVEGALRSRLGSPLERWEMARKMRKLGRDGDGHVEAAFGPDWCKGHFGDHGQLTLSRYDQRVQALEQTRAQP